MAIWPEYDCSRVVRAAQIVNIFEASGPLTCRVLFVDPGDGHIEPFICSDDDATNRAQTGWMAVVYKDGLKNAFPKSSFDSDYHRRDAVPPADPSVVVVS